jgi:hypothetical protein
VFQALVGALNDDDYAVIRQAVRSLRTLTGQDFGEDGSRWLSWADEHDELFAGKQPYYYPQYDAPPSFWQKLKFWATEEAPQRRRPRGLEVAAAEGEPSAQQAAGGSSERSASRESGESSGSSASAEPRTDSSRSDSDSDKSKDDAEAWRKAHPLGATDGG